MGPRSNFEFEVERTHTMNRLAILITLLLATSGCDQLLQTPKAPAEQKAQPILLDRYEIHEIRNGNFAGTALLDKQTGRVWTMGTSSNKEGKIDSVSFGEAGVYPSVQSLALADAIAAKRQAEQTSAAPK
jgi:hypothetical protein